MQQLITTEQAKKITHGRTPLVPVEYERAIRSLTACLSLDEAKEWSDKSDALAAWAKMYKSDDAGRKARQLKLHAFRRMAEIAEELQPQEFKSKTKGKNGRFTSGGTTPGPRALLVSKGLTVGEATASRRLAKLSKEAFDSLANRRRVPSPFVAMTIMADASDAWKAVFKPMMTLRSVLRTNPAKETRGTLTEEEVKVAKVLILEIYEWMDEFEMTTIERVLRK